MKYKTHILSHVQKPFTIFGMNTKFLFAGIGAVAVIVLPIAKLMPSKAGMILMILSFVMIASVKRLSAKDIHIVEVLFLPVLFYGFKKHKHLMARDIKKGAK